MEKIKFKSVFRYSRNEKIFRLIRIIYNKVNVGNGKGYSAKISLALMPKLFIYKKELFGFKLCILGIRLHHKKSYGGYLV